MSVVFFDAIPQMILAHSFSPFPQYHAIDYWAYHVAPASAVDDKGGVPSKAEGCDGRAKCERASKVRERAKSEASVERRGCKCRPNIVVEIKPLEGLIIQLASICHPHPHLSVRGCGR